MKRIPEYSVCIITFVITLCLNISIKNYPPIAKVLDPFHGFWQNAEKKALNIPTEVSLKELHDTAYVYFDEYLIPHIQANNDHDLYFIQGYITAFHRLWQMDFMSRAAAGRLSEILGARAVDHDRLQRRKGMVYAAENALANMQQNAISNEVVAAYTEGVNAYIHSLTYKDLPLEYKLLSTIPEDWTPLKTALIGIQMADKLGGYEQSLENVYAFDVLSERKLALLFPDHDPYHEPVIPKNTLWSFKPHAINHHPITPPQPKAGVTAAKQHAEVKNRHTDGSNNWVISGKKTINGYPYLANDPHLDLQLPAIWYAVHLSSPTVNVIGSSFPGIPNVILGFNEHVAWGVTNATWTVRDFYAIKFKDETRKEYYYDGLLLKTQTQTETICVKGGKQIQEEVLYTHLGPVVYDDNFAPRNHYKNMAMQWTGHKADNEILTFYLLNRSHNFKTFEEGLQYYSVPALNFAFASNAGDIALRIAGKLPKRLPQQGKFIMPGNDSKYQIQGYITPEHCPKIVNPATNYVCSANEKATDQHYPYVYHHFWQENYRNRRLNQLLSQTKKVGIESLMKWQNDNYNLAAKENIPFLLSFIDPAALDTQEQKMYQILLTWDFHNDVDQVAPSIFMTFTDELMMRLWQELDAYKPTIRTPNFYETMAILKDSAACKELNLPQGADLKAVIVESFQYAAHVLQEWEARHKKPYTWGAYRKISIPHLVLREPFGVAHVPIGGGDGILNANSAGNNSAHGVSMRLLVSLEKVPVGWYIYPGGQSGNPGNPAYTQFLSLWSAGKYIPLTLTMPKQDQNTSKHSIVFMPK